MNATSAARVLVREPAAIPNHKHASGVVRAQRTATEPVRIREALAKAHQELTGKAATPQMLDVLSAHVSHETASGSKMYNYNFGGIKGSSPDGLSARYKTTEVLRGRTTKIVDGFRAYGSLDDGARDYLLFLQSRYDQAYKQAERGDVDGFSHALKDKGYYTAPAEGYARGLRRHMDAGALEGMDYSGLSGGTYSLTPLSQAGAGGRYLYGTELALEGMRMEGMSQELPTSVAIARVLDSVGGLAARIGAPTDDLDGEDAW